MHGDQTPRVMPTTLHRHMTVFERMQHAIATVSDGITLNLLRPLTEFHMCLVKTISQGTHEEERTNYVTTNLKPFFKKDCNLRKIGN